jgi:hypothetical protein
MKAKSIIALVLVLSGGLFLSLMSMVLKVIAPAITPKNPRPASPKGRGEVTAFFGGGRLPWC